MAVLQKAKDAGQIKGFTGNDYTDGLDQGRHRRLRRLDRRRRAAAVRERQGAATPCRRPASPLWSDNFVIPALAKHKKNAETLINYYYDPDVMAQVEAYVNYIPPVAGAKEALAKNDPSSPTNPLIFPSQEVLARAAGLPGPHRRGGDQVLQPRRLQAWSPPADGRARGAGDLRLVAADQDVRRVHRGAAASTSTIPHGLVLRAARPVGLRQDDDAADGRRARGSPPPARSSSATATSPTRAPTSATSTRCSRATRSSRT